MIKIRFSFIIVLISSTASAIPRMDRSPVLPSIWYKSDTIILQPALVDTIAMPEAYTMMMVYQSLKPDTAQPLWTMATDSSSFTVVANRPIAVPVIYTMNHSLPIDTTDIESCRLYIGSTQDSISHIRLHEVAYFPLSLLRPQALMFQTYLALQYGITLDRANYLSTNGDVLWDARKYRDFHHHIQGVGSNPFYGYYAVSSVCADDSLLTFSVLDRLLDDSYVLLGDNGNERFQYTGKELDMETGYNFFGARNYMSDVPTWLSPDPLSDKYPNISPYAYCGWNPMKYVDPMGERPIYSLSGELMGTDEYGLQGLAVVMSDENFTQNMSSKDAEKFDIGIDALSKNAYQKYYKSYNNLSSRPDWDGYITLNEANDWYRNGNGAPLFADLGKIDMSRILSLGENFVGQKKSVNLLTNSKSIKTGLVYGNITLKRYPNHQVKAYSDTYNFEMHNWSNPLNWGRNIETIIGSKVAGNGVPYIINFYGSQTLTPILPWIK